MKKYIFVRFLRSCVSIFMVTTIAYLLIFSLVPRYRIFQADQTWAKLPALSDSRKLYELNKYQELGYIKYREQQQFCRAKFTNGSPEYFDCMNPLSDSFKAIQKEYEAKGYVFGIYKTTNTAYATREISILERVTSFYMTMFVLDHPGKISDPTNPDLARKIYIGKDWSGKPALLCSGCDYKYLVYLIRRMEGCLFFKS
jgi:oligopeptide transport system permease protein